MAYLLNIILPNRFSMVIWDVFPDALKITGMTESNVVYKSWVYLNKKSFKKAFKVFTIGEKMAELLEQYLPKEKILIEPIWSIFQTNERINKLNNRFIKEHHLENKFVVQYSGNIGLTHKVEVIVALAELLQEHKDIVFQIIGRGPKFPALKKLVEEKKLPNCTFLPFQSDEMFPYSLSAADLGIVTLDEITSKGSIPSKSYNLMSYGIPSMYIAGKDSELFNYAHKYNHAVCFQVSQLTMAKEFIIKLSNDKEYWHLLSENALRTSKLFSRKNADKFVTSYIK